MILKPLMKIVSQIRETFPKAPIIYFGREISDYYPTIIKNIPNLTLAFDQFVEPIQIRDQFQTVIPVQGNLDPDLLVQGGDNLTLATQNLLDVLGKGPYVFNLGHGILPQTPISHVQHVIDLVRQTQGF